MRTSLFNKLLVVKRGPVYLNLSIHRYIIEFVVINQPVVMLAKLVESVNNVLCSIVKVAGSQV